MSQNLSKIREENRSTEIRDVRNVSVLAKTPVIKKLNLLFLRDVILETVIERVRTNLDIVLVLIPIGLKFRTRCQMVPSLMNCWTID
jgi:dynein heavy chain